MSLEDYLGKKDNTIPRAKICCSLTIARTNCCTETMKNQMLGGHETRGSFEFEECLPPPVKEL